MPRKPRDYAFEYARRISRGSSKGFSRSQARGHPRAGEGESQKAAAAADISALKMMKRGATLTEAARSNGIGSERLRRYLRENADATYSGRKWTIKDRRTFRFPFYSKGRVTKPWLSAPEASEAGSYMAAVRQALRKGDPWLLTPFRGEGATDRAAKFHPFETDLNTLYALDLAGEASIPETYRIQGAV